MFVKRSIRFILHKRKLVEATAFAIRMRVTIKGQKPLDFPLDKKIFEEHWDAKRECATSKAKDASEINSLIEEYKARINEVFARYELIEKKIPTPQDVKELFNHFVGKASIFDVHAITIEDAFTEYIAVVGEKNSWTDSSYKKNATIKKHFVSAVGNITFGQITTEKLQLFINYLLGTGLRNTTALKDYQFVRWFLRWARNKGYYHGNADNEFKPKLKGTDGNQKEILYLSLDELKQLRKFEVPKDLTHLQHVKDVFLFCCYTSLRYSDAKALKRSDVYNNNIHVVTQKTTDALVIELNTHAREILKRYEDNSSINKPALPVISNQKYNKYLKELGKLAGLNSPTRVVYYKGNERFDEYYPKYELLTTHCARRTFVVTALQLGIPVEVIIRWTGHSDYEAMKPYVAIVDELKRKEMNKFDLI